MPQGDKTAYTDKQKRQAQHIEKGYEQRGLNKSEAEGRAWATVNKETHGGKQSGSGRSKAEDHSSSRKSGHIGGNHSHGGKTAANTNHDKRSAAAKKGWATRRSHAA